MTSSTGCSGLTRFGSPPSRAMPSRMAARSTTAGTPVKSCSSTRAGANEISFCAALFRSHRASASMSAAFDEAAVLVAQQVLEQDLHRERQGGNLGKSRGLERRQAVNLEGAAADVEGGPGTEAVHGRHEHVLAKKASYHTGLCVVISGRKFRNNTHLNCQRREIMARLRVLFITTHYVAVCLPGASTRSGHRAGDQRGGHSVDAHPTALVLLMTPALAFFYGGLVRSKNT